MVQITDIEEEVYESLELDYIRSHKKNEFTSMIFGNNASIENYILVQSAAETNSEIAAQANQLKQLLGARAIVLQTKIDLLTTEEGEADFTYSVENTVALQEAKNEFLSAYGSDLIEISGDAKIFKEQMEALRNGELSTFQSNRQQLKEASAELNEVQALNVVPAYESSEAATLVEHADQYRVTLLKHLAGSIVVKEHRIRYQKEQFDRFIVSNKMPNLKSNNLTLRQFATNYAGLIETMTESSHNDKCPKIEANYDDFGEQTIKPLNATIFYYFFGADRAGRTWAQWMLASARYPNERVRRAYIRFFA